ncbi:hypothetical protein Tco_0779411 [Tanacetum coccineum]
MAQLNYCDKHNQVGFLRKPDESAGFAEIVDFLRGFNLRPLLPAMLLVATTNPSAGQEHPDVAQSQPSSSIVPVPSTSLPPVQSPPPITTPIPASTPTPIPKTDPEPMEHTFEEPSPAHQHFSPPQEHAQEQMTVDDLLRLNLVLQNTILPDLTVILPRIKSFTIYFHTKPKHDWKECEKILSEGVVYIF